MKAGVMTSRNVELLLFTLVAVCAPVLRANLAIDATFDSSITSDPNASVIEDSINQTIARIESDIVNPITVNITFAAMSSGLGQSDTFFETLSYSTYRSDLQNNQILSRNDQQAIASLPVQALNPVNGDSNITLTTALYKALGGSYSGPDSTVSLNLSMMNLSRIGPQDPNLYDLQAVTAHEIDEALGAGGAGSILSATGGTNGPVGVLDLFRYSASGVRSFTTNGSATSYFSINGGVTNLSNFNQDSNGDYADWVTGSTPQVQDAFATPGIQLNVGTNELTSLDVIGYNLISVPEPSTWAFVALGGLGMITLFRRRHSGLAKAE